VVIEANSRERAKRGMRMARRAYLIRRRVIEASPKFYVLDLIRFQVAAFALRLPFEEGHRRCFERREADEGF